MANDTYHDFCIVCDSLITRTSRGVCDIFRNKTQFTKELLSDKLSSIFGVHLLSSVEENHFICKKCYRLLEEIDDLEESIYAFKNDLCEKFRYRNSRKNSIQAFKTEIKHEQSFSNTNIDISQNMEEIPYTEQLASTPIIENGQSMQIEENNMNWNVNRIEIPKIIEVAEEVNKDDVIPFKESNLNGPNYVLEDKLTLNPPVVKKKRGRKPGSASGNFKCPYCEKHFTVRRFITDHIKYAHKGINPFKCDICKEEFTLKRDLMQHVADHENVGDEFRCEVCQKSFYQFKQFRDHQRFHAGKVLLCDLCGKCFLNIKELLEHDSLHTADQMLKCNVCDHTFALRVCYKAHLKTHDVGEKSHKCDTCGKMFFHISQLQEHLKIHADSHPCDVCGKVFNTYRALEVHAPVHGEARPFRCQFCGKGFLRKPQLANHERTHTGERPYQCEECGTTFCQRSNLYSHKKYTHEQDRKYRCEICGKGFKRRRLLNWHRMSVHTGEKPLICEICGTGFVYPGHLKKHMIIHTGEKPWKCAYCGKGFASKDNRNAHQYIHTDRKPYECGLCQQGFMRKPMLLNHITQDHPQCNPEVLIQTIHTENDDSQFEITNDDSTIISDISVPVLNTQNFGPLLQGQTIVVTHHRSSHMEPIVEIHATPQELIESDEVTVATLQ